MKLKVKQIKEEAGNAFSVIFENPHNRFYPGQYIEIEDRCFSIASSPSEDFLMITTRPGISDFKKKLAKIKPEDILESSHPAGTFTIDEADPAVFIAGGIGITPFRSMIKWAFDRKLNLPITLIYLNSDENFIYQKELDRWQKKLPNLTIHYINTSKTGRLTADALNRYSIHDKQNTIYYLAGSPSFVDDFEKILLNLGVDSTNIRTDRYDGY